MGETLVQQRSKLLVGASALALLAWTPALAQTTPIAAVVPAPAPTEVLDEVVVTGTRLNNTNFTAPTPVQTVNSKIIQQRAPAAISDVINELPAFRITRAATGIGRVADQQSGVQALLDLRGLGFTETLTLINGERTVPTVAQGSFDSNMIPVGLVDRVDVVTGGASAAYGSDAVAGVVNYVLKNHMQGVEGSLQAGGTERGDGRQWVGTLAAGTSFMDGRGHIIAGADYAKSDGAGSMYTRDWGRKEPGLLAVSAAQRASLGLPAQVFSNGVELANATPGSLITTKTTAGQLYAFDGSGNPYLFNQSANQFGSGVTATMVSSANYGYSPLGAFRLQNANDRLALYSRGDFEVSPNTTIYAEASYGRTHLPPQLTAYYTTSLLVPRTSLPTSIQSLYTGTNVTLGRIDTEVGGGNQTWQTNDTKRFVLGGESHLGEWVVRGYYQYGRTHQDFATSGLVTAALNKAVYGCNGGLTNPNMTATLVAQAALYEQLTGKTCAAFNPFGVQSDAAAAYFHTDQQQQTAIGQDAAEVTLSGPIFTLPAGDVSLTVGGDWRRDTLKVTGSTLGAANLFSQGNFGSYGGTNSVTEGFGEIGVPLLRDLAWAKSLDFNAAVRRTHYRLSGSVTTWKVGGAYAPIDGVRFRITQSRDIRAPSLQDLFFVGGALPTSLTNAIPGTFGFGVTSTSNVNGAGNPALVPEKADTFTTGVVLQPTGGPFRGLRAALDYYRIQVNGAIARPSTAQTQNICAAIIAAGGTSCPGIVFSTSGNGIASQSNLSLNLNALKVEGLDFELAYRLPSLPTPGSLEIRLLLNRALHDQQVLSTGAFELAGSMNGVPRWNGNLTFAYQLRKFGAELQFTGFTGVKYDTLTLFPASVTQTVAGLAADPSDPGYVVTNNSSINKNRFPGAAYTNLSLHYDITGALQVFGVVNNLFDIQPPAFAAIAETSGTRNLNYDLLGRAFKLGARFKF